MLRTVITGIGSYIPTDIKTNKNFLSNDFYNEDKSHIETDSSEIVDKFRIITGIEERRYASEDLNTSDIGTIAAKEAIAESKKAFVK